MVFILLSMVTSSLNSKLVSFKLEVKGGGGSLDHVEGQSAPQWLSSDETDAWISLSWLMFRLPAALDAQLQRDSGLSFFEYLVLAGLSMAPGRRLRMSELAQFANGSLSRLSNVVKRLEERGWLYREPCAANGRFIEAALTDAGFAVVQKAAPGHVDTVRRYVFDALDPGQIAELSEVGRRIADRVEPDREWPPTVRRSGGAPS
jgi:DNA-binding MarR family transcriptional regulator